MTQSAPGTTRMLSQLRTSFIPMSQPFTAPIQPVGQTAPAPSPPLTDEEKLNLFDQVLQQVEQESVVASPALGTPTTPPMRPIQPADTVVTATPVISQSQPTAPTPTKQFLDTLHTNVQDYGSIALEDSVPLQPSVSEPSTQSPPQVGASMKERHASSVAPVEAGANVQWVEYEKSPEIPPEVESYLTKVEDNQDQLPQEIVIADGTTQVNPTQFPAPPLIVLPITHEIEEAGKKKNPTWSIRWLVEWSRKIMKLFAGRAVYRQEN